MAARIARYSGLAEERPPVKAVPFIAVMRREAAARDQRKALRIRWTRRVGFGVVALATLHVALTSFINPAPSDATLRAYVEALGPAILTLQSTPSQPLSLLSTSVRHSDRPASNRIRYCAEITLVLAQPLYAPAASNGTVAYRQLQQSLQSARETNLRMKLISDDGPQPPEMPLLIQTVHRAGERVTVRVPFEAERFGWRWRLGAPQVTGRTADRSFDGWTMERFASVPHILFGAPGSLAETRSRAECARAYIVAIANEVQKRADAAAEDLPRANAAATAIPVLDRSGRIDPYAPAVEPGVPAFDPDAPAVSSKATTEAAAL